MRSAKDLGRGFYTDQEIAAYIHQYGTLDRSLIVDGTFFVVEERGAVVGCGGWSAREPHYAAAMESSPATDALPRIQGFFVEPDRARQGIGRAVMSHIEGEIQRAGHSSAVLIAMLSGVAFYRALSYRKTRNNLVTLSNGMVLPSIEMIKHFADVGPPHRRRPTSDHLKGNVHA